MTIFSFTNIRPPNAGGNTVVAGINASGDVAGSYEQIIGGTEHGFLYSKGNFTDFGIVGTVTGLNDSDQVIGINSGGAFIYQNGNFTYLNDPSGSSTYPAAINASGEVAGSYKDNSGVNHGFIYSNGNFTNFDDPNAGIQGTGVAAINASDQVVGDYLDNSNVEHGFIYHNGNIIEISDPAAGSSGNFSGTIVTAINTAGDVAGFYFDGSGVAHGFIYHSGTFANFSDPGAAPNSGGAGTFVYGINDSDEVTGYYNDSSGVSHGFVYNGDTFTNFSAPYAGGSPGFGSEPTAINNSGQVAGNYQSAAEQGFIATPVPILGGSGDYDTDGDRNGELLWQNLDGTVVSWDMNGAQLASIASLAQVPANWQLAGTGHFAGAPGSSSNTDAIFRSDAGDFLIVEFNATR